MTEPSRYSSRNSLLQSLLREHLDPGYAAAARAREDGAGSSRIPQWLWLMVGCAVIGLVVGVAAVTIGEDSDDYRREVLSSVDAAEERNDELSTQRSELNTVADAARARALAGNTEGEQVLDRLRTLESAAGAEPVHGPGIVVTLDDRAAVKDRSVVLDRDVQAVVNALWASGAEAVSIGDVRVGPGVTVRQAGGAMLVDNKPVPSPYKIAAVGSPGQLETGFVVSPAYLRMSAVAQLYDIEFDVSAKEDLRLRGATVHELRSAEEATR
ncbi:DUF881 domain-containing protein [Aldersonia kunmingensis]|uniref:DUF881 domain-containing protein n=1 Tax=Aldersonia kunmingensis TaxID=408066 RepID=UPI000831072B|nr:DUF881 domain-containing protein [Aldersonia kunmingensis]